MDLPVSLTSHHAVLSQSLTDIFVPVGGHLITMTGDMLSVFYVAAIGHAICAFLIIFILPESLSLESRLANREAAKVSSDSSSDNRGGAGIKRMVWEAVKGLFSFLTPLVIFIPRKRVPGEPGYVNGKRDWNLTLLVGSACTLYMLLVSRQSEDGCGIDPWTD